MRYERPECVEDAVALLADGTGWRILAGGTDLYPATTAQVLEGPILDIGGIAQIKGVGSTPDGWRIGAGATWSDLIASPLPPGFDALKEAARDVGSVQIQNCATVAGNLCNASPAADGVAVLLAMEAEVELTGPGGTRRLPLGEFVLGNRRTARAADEIVVAIHVPAEGGAGASAFEKLGARRYLVISIAMAAARVVVREGRIAHATLSVGACSEVARRLPEIEAGLVGHPAASLPRIDRAAVAASLAPIDDMRATAAYRAAAAGEIAERALRRALAAARALSGMQG